APWNGYAASVTGSLPLVWPASARAPSASTPAVSAVPAAPDSVPLRKLRRLTFTRGCSFWRVRLRREGFNGPGELPGDPEPRRVSEAPHRWPNPRARAPRGRRWQVTPTGR